MATAGKNLSDTDLLPRARHQWRIAIVKSQWNSEITDRLADGARETLLSAGLPEYNIIELNVPGSFELPLGALWAIEHSSVDAVVCLGAVIRGETPHFEYVCQAVSQGIKDVGIKTSKPVIFGVLTDNNIEQSRDRSGGKHGNKGIEAASTALRMLALRDSL
ncbi:MAG: 6,7-dimethyl-8-ribityllumazine synthase [Salibacteraceae bacterium]